MITYSFENLEVWKQSKKLVLYVYKLQANFPTTERYGLGDQLRRAVISVSSNIAEGTGRRSVKEQLHFIDISFGSLMEVYCQIILAFELQYISEQQFTECKDLIHPISKMLNGLRYQKLSLLDSKPLNLKT